MTKDDLLKELAQREVVIEILLTAIRNIHNNIHTLNFNIDGVEVDIETWINFVKNYGKEIIKDNKRQKGE